MVCTRLVFVGHWARSEDNGRVSMFWCRMASGADRSIWRSVAASCWGDDSSFRSMPKSGDGGERTHSEFKAEDWEGKTTAVGCVRQCRRGREDARRLVGRAFR